MLHEEGLDNVFARHDRAAEATRRAVRHWGFEIQCRNPGEYSTSLTAVRLPEGHSADGFAPRSSRAQHVARQRPRPLADQVFRIGHLGDFHDLMVTGTLSGVEIGLKARGIPHRSGRRPRGTRGRARGGENPKREGGGGETLM